MSRRRSVVVRTYSVFDADPNSSSSGLWHDRTDVPAEGDTLEEAVAFVRGELAECAEGLRADDGYDVGQRLYALLVDADGTTLQLSHEIEVVS